MCGCNFVTQYNLSLSSFVPNFRALSQVVAEKSLTEKKVYRKTNQHTNKHNYRKGKNYIPLYTSYWGYNYNLNLLLIHQVSYSKGYQWYLMHREVLGSIWKIGRYPIKVSEVLLCLSYNFLVNTYVMWVWMSAIIFIIARRSRSIYM